MAKMELTEEQWQKLGQHLPQDGDFLFSLLPNSDYMLNAVRHGVVLNSRMLVYLLLTERFHADCRRREAYRRCL